MAVPSKVLMVGLPRSGKTTFLAALWHIVQEAGVSTSMRLKELRGDRTYLNRIRDAWLSCKPLERTTIQDEQIVTLCLQNQAGDEIELTIPDLSGEAFELQLRERRWPVAFDALVNDASGILLFIHPDAIQAGHRADFAKSLEAQLRPIGPATAVGSASAEASAGTTSLPWSVDLMPTQVQLVELVQFLAERRGSSERLRVAVIVSAWDLVESLVASPTEVLRRQLPLLSQFLNASAEKISHVVVGVSAQGGDLDQDRTALLNRDSPSLRVRVIGLDCDEHDLSAPVSWLLG